MKKFLIAFLLIQAAVFGQNTNKNYIKSSTYNYPPGSTTTTTPGGNYVYSDYMLEQDMSTGEAQSFFTDYGVGYVTISILNDVLKVEFNAVFNTPGTVQTNVQTNTIMSNIPIPDMVLGYLDCGSGFADLIKVSIINNMLQLEDTRSYISVDSFNETFTVALSPYADLSGTASPPEITEKITYFDGLGRPVQKIAIGQSPKNPKNINLLDWNSTWTLGSGSVSGFNQNGTTSENTRVKGQNPFGEKEILWECGTDAAVDGDGGWNTSNIVIDKNVSYRYSVWVKRTGSTDGLTHHGTSNVLNLDGTVDSNPYFWYGDLPTINEWYLMVGMIHPASYTGADSGISGIYDINGNKVLDGTEYKWNTTTANAYFRSYFYYAADLNTKQYFYNPIIQKFDGTQSTISELTSNDKPADIVKHIEYDNFGRENKSYLPYASKNSSNGNDYTNPLTDLSNFYNTPKYENTLNPYSEIRFDAMPINRVLEQGTAGNAWKVIANSDADSTIKFDYQFNSVSDKVKVFKVNTSSLPQDTGYYPVNELFKTISKNENWKPTQTNLTDNTTVEFKNKQGQLVLKRNFSEGKWHDTYHVYDDYGNLTYVLPPIVNTYPNQQQIWPNQLQDYSEVDSFYLQPYNDYPGYNEGSVTLSGNYLYFYFENFGEGPNAPLNTTSPVVDLNFNPPLPDMNLGPILIEMADGSYSDQYYSAYVQNGDIYLSNNGGTSVPAYGVYIELDKDMATITANLGIVIDQTMMNDYGYHYKYDERNRLIEKKLPGKDPEYIVYDQLDRPILTQDGNLKAQNKWLFIKYNAFNKVAYSGIWTNPTVNQDRQGVQTQVDTQTTPVWHETKTTTAASIGFPASTVYYSNNAFPKVNASIEVLAINYYDNYTFDNLGLSNNVVSFNVTPTTNAKSLTTGSKVKILGTNDWITNITCYDEKGRAIYNASNNAYLNTTDVVKMKLDFIGKILETESSHVKGAFTISINDFFTYDPAGRLLTQKQKIDNQDEQLIFKYTYDELGNIISKNVGGKTNIIGEQGLQKVDFNYNIRGWLKDINSVSRMENDLFAMTFNYQEPTIPSYAYSTYAVPLYNGNISEVSWKSDNISSSLKTYYYGYDNLDRMKIAVYAENSVINSKFNENISQYDRNGNIMALSRTSQSSTNPSAVEGIDNLTYQYKGNQLMSVKDNYGQTAANAIQGFKDGNLFGNDYDYDANGNMKFDKNKGIVTNIEYNHFNLPVKIVFNASEGTPNPKVITYKYNGAGIKIEKKVLEPKLINGSLQNTTTITQYDGNAVYINGVLQFFSQSEGYVAYDASATAPFDKYTYVFQYKDLMGNVRLSYKDNNNDGLITGASTEVFHDNFESNSGWDSTGAMYGISASYDTTKKHSGNVSAKLERTSSTANYAHSNTWLTVANTQPTDYIFSGWVYSNAPIAQLHLFMMQSGETNYFTQVDYVRTNVTNRWVYIEKKVTVPANITILNLRIDNTGPAGTVWFDDVSIRRVNPVNEIEIIEENNFYPYGLKHKDGNNIIAGFGNAMAQQFKYQGQERQEELGLMWDSFKWRNYDPATGRFMSIDPLAEKYTYNSTYAFQENKMGLGRELEGLELYNSDGSFNSENAWNAAGGVWNVACGVIGAIGTGAVIAETGGAGALVLGTSFMLSIGEIGIGIGQIADALGNNSGNQALQQSSSIPGLIAYQNGSPNAGAWNAAGAFLPGLFTGGASALSAGNSYRSAIWEISGLKGFLSIGDDVVKGNAAGVVETVDGLMDSNDLLDEAENIAEDAFTSDSSSGSGAGSGAASAGTPPAVSTQAITTQNTAAATPINYVIFQGPHPFGTRHIDFTITITINAPESKGSGDSGQQKSEQSNGNSDLRKGTIELPENGFDD